MSEWTALHDDCDLLLREAAEQIGALTAPLVRDMVVRHASVLCRRRIEAQDLVPRRSVIDQPTAYELLVAGLEEIAALATRRPSATATGAHDALRRVAVEMGVYRADTVLAFRRTRGEIEAAKDAAFDLAVRGTRSAAKERQA